MILAPMLLYGSSTPFPGLNALVPCIGAALIIHAGGGQGSTRPLANQVIGWLPIRFVGLISYSIYLWHWPIIVFQNADGLIFLNGTKISSKLGLVAVTIMAATASWALIERPTRRLGSLKPRMVIPSAMVAGAALVVGCALVIVSGGFPTRYPPEAARIAAYPIKDDAHFRPKQCFLIGQDSLSDFNKDVCLHVDSGRPNYLILGDSHAAQLWYGMAHAMPGINFEQATVGGCFPTVVDTGFSKRYCRDIMDQIYGSFLPGHPPRKLILAARWTARVLPALTDTLRHLKEKQVDVVLIGPIVEYSYPLPRLLADAIRFHDPGRQSRFEDPDPVALDAVLAKLAGSMGIEYVSLRTLLCPAGHCLTLDQNGAPIQFDSTHLTASGSVLLARMLKDHGSLP